MMNYFAKSFKCFHIWVLNIFSNSCCCTLLCKRVSLFNSQLCKHLETGHHSDLCCTGTMRRQCSRGDSHPAKCHRHAYNQKTGTLKWKNATNMEQIHCRVLSRQQRREKLQNASEHAKNHNIKMESQLHQTIVTKFII